MGRWPRASTFLLLASFAAAAPLVAPASQGGPAPLAAAWWVAGSDAYFFTTYDHAEAVIAALRSAHMNTFYADAKDERGWVGWTSQEGWPTPFAFAPGDGPVERAVRAAQAGGPRLAVAARYSTYQDEAAATGPLAAARIGATWWLDPACPGVRTHVIAQVLDLVAHAAVDEVNLDFLRYPAWGDVGVNVDLPCTGGKLLDEDPTRFDVIVEETAAIVTALKAAYPTVTVSADTFGYACYAPMMDIGQDVARLAPLLDWAMPMLYPAYFAAPAGLLPYQTVRDAVEACVAKVGDADKVKPWVQGFNQPPYPHANPASVAQQIDGARDAGGTGATVWWFESYGMAPAGGQPLPSALAWAPLADHMPADWLHRPYR